MNDYLYKNWIERNWNWALPLGGCLTIVVVGIITAITLFSKVGSIINDNQPYQLALEKAKNSEWVISRLGEPIEGRGNTYNNYSYKNGRATVDFKTNLAGSNGKEAELNAAAEKKGEEWVFTIMEVSIDSTEEVFDLLTDQEVLQEKIDQ